MMDVIVFFPPQFELALKNSSEVVVWMVSESRSTWENHCWRIYVELLKHSPEGQAEEFKGSGFKIFQAWRNQSQKKGSSVVSGIVNCSRFLKGFYFYERETLCTRVTGYPKSTNSVCLWKKQYHLAYYIHYISISNYSKLINYHQHDVAVFFKVPLILQLLGQLSTLLQYSI